jgi:hypothetical protein
MLMLAKMSKTTRMSLVLTFWILALAGCASAPEQQLPRVVTVEVPVIQPCPVKVPERAEYATAKLSKKASDFDKIKAILVERKQRETAENELRRLLVVCVKLP